MAVAISEVETLEEAEVEEVQEGIRTTETLGVSLIFFKNKIKLIRNHNSQLQISPMTLTGTQTEVHLVHAITSTTT